MAVSEEQKCSRIKQKKRRDEESPHSNMLVVCDLDVQQISPKDSGKKMNKEKYFEGEGSRARENKLAQESNDVPSCIDKLREELSCPICLEICYEPTSLWCGHSFCIRCLRLAVFKFGNKCPKCQHFIRKGRPYILNTVIRNTIQLLFSQEVVVIRDLDEQQISPKDSGKKMKKKKYSEGEGSRARENKLTQESNGLSSCIDKLREELSCPICFDIFFVPVSTVCGHSFCCGCLDRSSIKNGNKCPICRQSISFSLEYNENTVIVNTTNLLFYPEGNPRIDDMIKERLAARNRRHIRFEQEE